MKKQEHEKQITVTAAPFWRINFKSQLPPRRISKVLQLPSCHLWNIICNTYFSNGILSDCPAPFNFPNILQSAFGCFFNLAQLLKHSKSAIKIHIGRTPSSKALRKMQTPRICEPFCTRHRIKFSPGTSITTQLHSGIPQAACSPVAAESPANRSRVIIHLLFQAQLTVHNTNEPHKETC